MLSLIRDHIEESQQNFILIRKLEEIKGEIEGLKQEVNDLKRLMIRSKSTVSLLTKRENDIYRLLGEGKTNLHIASYLGISEKTVKNHVSRIMKKLKVKNRTEAVIMNYKFQEKA